MLINCRSASFILPLALLLLMCSGCSDAEQAAHDEAIAEDTVAAYRSFLEEYPDGRLAESARDRLRALQEADAWREAQSASSMEAFDRFLDEYPRSEHADAAREKLTRIQVAAAWESVQLVGTEQAYKTFLEDYPESEHVPLAREALDRLRHDSAWEEALAADEMDIYSEFIASHPESHMRERAQSRLDELSQRRAWLDACTDHTPEAFERLVKEHPQHPRAAEARFRSTLLSRAAQLQDLRATEAVLTGKGDTKAGFSISGPFSLGSILIPEGTVVALGVEGELPVFLPSEIPGGTTVTLIGGDEVMPSIGQFRSNWKPIAAVLPEHAALEDDIHAAAREGDAERVRQLLAQDANWVAARDMLGRTPLMLACGAGHEQIAERLIAAGTEVNATLPDGTTALYHAARAGEVKLAIALIDAGAGDCVRSLDRDTPLHRAASRGDAELVSMLVELGANVDAARVDRSTPILLAAANGHLAAVRALLDGGANPAPHAPGLMSPLGAAERFDHDEIATLLRKHLQP